ncbi:hypothetical protein H2200_008901 [Cladophialophora chaetospira]|uniref:Extracellular mutant protein 11 C-terminal domain-containing protein n=1 Tax=Cladophialophora chaetospira TaxID=386627 RepID=A0AA38X4Y3_9EURO|nr:hypothetical protein H2200_008901 [Cladophialophora chaetospira]
MPLANDSKDKNKSSALNYVNRASVAPPRSAPRSMTPQPNTGRERTIQGQDENRRKSHGPIQYKENKPPPSREEAAALKLNVPDTRPKSKLAQSTTINAAQRPAIAQHNIYGDQMPANDKVFNVFDHTESFDIDDSMSGIDGQGAPLQPSFSFAPGRTGPRLRGGPPIRPPTDFYQGLDDQPEEDEQAAGLPQNWMHEADAERARQGIKPKYSNDFNGNAYHVQQDEEGYDDESEQDGDVEEGRSLMENTPSRTRIPQHETVVQSRQETALKTVKAEAAPRPSLPTHRKSLSDAMPTGKAGPPVQQQPVRDRFHAYKQPVHMPQETNPEIQRSRSPQPVVHAPQPRPAQVQTAQFASKASSLHDSTSEEESLPPHIPESPRPGTKRPLPTQELDFDQNQLKTKTIAELDAIAFPIDPRLPINSPVLDSNGQTLVLSTKLANLTKMRPEDQATLFRTLDDTEREQTAAWFLDKFRTDMQKLIAVRVERRKIALKYEMEVKKRERQVQVKKGDVEEELVGLKKGGSELVRGKSPAK